MIRTAFVSAVLAVCFYQCLANLSDNEHDRRWVEKQVENFDQYKLVVSADQNNDGEISLNELNELIKGYDLNKDGQLRECELVSSLVTRYDVGPFVASFIFDILDANNDGFFNETTEGGNLDLDNDGKISLKELVTAYQSTIRAAANRQYDAVNGFVSDGKSTPEYSVDYIRNLVTTQYDSNKDGFINENDTISGQTFTRCSFVDVHVSQLYGPTRSFFNRVFSLLDTNQDQIFDLKDARVIFFAGDYNKDGRLSTEEDAQYLSAVFRRVRFFSGFRFTNPFKCPGQENAGELDADQVVLDTDLDQNGNISALELEQYWEFYDSDANGELTLSEFVEKCVRRYMFHPNVAYEAFKVLDTNKDNKLVTGQDISFYSFDENKDGTITYCEYRKAVVRNIKLALKKAAEA